MNSFTEEEVEDEEIMPSKHDKVVQMPTTMDEISEEEHKDGGSFPRLIDNTELPSPANVNPRTQGMDGGNDAGV